jgi:hypothetical protein
MTALWVVVASLSLLVILNAVATIALTRQVGLLHLRVRPAPLDHGPRVGGRLLLDAPLVPAAPGAPVELVLVGFISPGCAACSVLLSAFRSIAPRLADRERVVLVSDAGEPELRAHLDRHGIALPLVSSPGALRANGVPGTPFAVVTDGDGVVLGTSGVTSLEQVEHLIEHARLRRDDGQPSPPHLQGLPQP